MVLYRIFSKNLKTLYKYIIKVNILSDSIFFAFPCVNFHPSFKYATEGLQFNVASNVKLKVKGVKENINDPSKQFGRLLHFLSWKVKKESAP